MPSGVRRCLPSTISAPSLQLSTFRLPPPSPAPLPLSHFPSSLLSHCHTWPHQRKDNFTRSHCSTIPLSHPSPSPGPRAPRLLKEGSDGMLMTSRAYFTTSPLPPCSPGTQRLLAHLSFPLSHYPSLRNDVPRALGFNSTSHLSTSPIPSDHTAATSTPIFPTLPLSQPRAASHPPQ